MNGHEMEVLGNCVFDLIAEAGATEEEGVHLMAKLLTSYCFEAGVTKENLLKIVAVCFDSLERLAEMDGVEIH